MRVEWFGGEPLLCMDVIENLSKHFIDICRKAHKGYTAAITTNGYLLDLETFRKLDGGLRKAIIDELKRKHSNYRYQDASFQEYGFGATMVTIK